MSLCLRRQCKNVWTNYGFSPYLLCKLLRSLMKASIKNSERKLQPSILWFHILITCTTFKMLSKQLNTSFHIHTIEAFCILDIQKGGRSPDSDSPIVGGTGQQSRQDGVPAHTVDCAGVTSQLCDGQLTAPVPDVNFVVWQETGHFISCYQFIGLDLNGNFTNFTNENLFTHHVEYFSGWNSALPGCT